MPLALWLIFACFDFWTIDQLISVLAISGLILNMTKFINNFIVKILSFLLMLLPVLIGLHEVKIDFLNYLPFQIPFVLFVITYLTFIFYSNNKLHTTQKCYVKQLHAE
ncbi:MAG: hypothetical protein P8Q42_03610 [Flavobacteriales bacterium]|nr:hypothetical protein [Flavobacteriales bacterium]